MRAYILDRYGQGGSRLADVPAPKPGPRDLLVKVHAAGLNPVDFKFQQGQLRVIMRPPLPFVLGNELAGEVIAVGRAARRFQVGDRIFARVTKDSGGTFAEQACIDEDCAAQMPPDMDFATAAAIPLAGLTALQALRDELRVRPGQAVLISGGAGVVGTYAIQIAKWLGAHVTTTASPRGEGLVRSLGSDAVIDYTSQDLTRVAQRFDAGFDLIGGDTLDQMFGLMKPSATGVSVAARPEPQTAMKDLGGRRLLAGLFWIASFGIRSRAARAGVRYRYLFMHPSGTELAELAALVEERKLKVVMDRIFDFDTIPEALAYVESGRAKGKVLVTIA